MKAGRNQTSCIPKYKRNEERENKRLILEISKNNQGFRSETEWFQSMHKTLGPILSITSLKKILKVKPYIFISLCKNRPLAKWRWEDCSSFCPIFLAKSRNSKFKDTLPQKQGKEQLMETPWPPCACSQNIVQLKPWNHAPLTYTRQLSEICLYC